MNSARTYGAPPFGVALVHGGPGAAGELAPVARELSLRRGVLEPLQTERSVDGQVRELRALLDERAALPVTLVGHSWGAWLSFMIAALHPGHVKKLILVAAGPFEETWVPLMNGTLAKRLTMEERAAAAAYTAMLEDPACENKKEVFARFGDLMTRAGAFDPIPSNNDMVEYRPDIFLPVMREAAQLRRSGRLLEMGRRITCPVVAMHGDHDCHPHQGVETPLSRVVRDFRFILLERCGHYPWNERFARDRFFALLEDEL